MCIYNELGCLAHIYLLIRPRVGGELSADATHKIFEPTVLGESWAKMTVVVPHPLPPTPIIDLCTALRLPQHKAADYPDGISSNDLRVNDMKYIVLPICIGPRSQVLGKI